MKLLKIIKAQEAVLADDTDELNKLLQEFNDKIFIKKESEQVVWDRIVWDRSAKIFDGLDAPELKQHDSDPIDDFSAESVETKIRNLKEFNDKELKKIAELIQNILNKAAVLRKKIKAKTSLTLKQIEDIIANLQTYITDFHEHLIKLMEASYHEQDNSLIQGYGYARLLNSSQQAKVPSNSVLSPAHPDFEFFCRFIWSTRGKNEVVVNELFGYPSPGDSRQQELTQRDTLYRFRLNQAFDRKFVYIPQGNAMCYSMTQSEYDKREDLLPVNSLIWVERQKLFVIKANGKSEEINNIETVNKNDLDEILTHENQWVSDNTLSKIGLTKQARIYRSIAREDIPEFPPAFAWFRPGTQLRYELFRDYKKAIAFDHIANQQHGLYASFYQAKKTNNTNELVKSYKDILEQIKRSNDTLEALTARRLELDQKKNGLSSFFQQKTRQVLDTLINNLECDIDAIKIQTIRVLEKFSKESKDLKNRVLSDPAVLFALKAEYNHFSIPTAVCDEVKKFEESQKDGAATLQESDVNDLKEKLEKEDYKTIVKEWCIKINHHLKENSSAKKPLLNKAAKEISEHIHKKTLKKLALGHKGKTEPEVEFIVSLHKQLDNENFDLFFNSDNSLCHFLLKFADTLKVNKNISGKTLFEQVIATPLANYKKQLNTFCNERQEENKPLFSLSLGSIVNLTFKRMLQFNLLTHEQKLALQKEMSGLKTKVSNAEQEIINTVLQMLSHDNPTKVVTDKEESTPSPNVELLINSLTTQVIQLNSPAKVNNDKVDEGLLKLIANIRNRATDNDLESLLLGLELLGYESLQNNKEREQVKALLQELGSMAEKSQALREKISILANNFAINTVTIQPRPVLSPRI